MSTSYQYPQRFCRDAASVLYQMWKPNQTTPAEAECIKELHTLSSWGLGRLHPWPIAFGTAAPSTDESVNCEDMIEDERLVLERLAHVCPECDYVCPDCEEGTDKPRVAKSSAELGPVARLLIEVLLQKLFERVGR